MIITESDIRDDPRAEDSLRLPTKLSISANFIWSLAGIGIFTACQWGMLIALSKLGSAEQVGQYSLGLAIASPIFLFARLGLRIVLVTDTRNENEFGEYLGLLILTTSLGLLGVIIAGWVPDFSVITVAVIIIVGIAKAIENISYLIYGLFQKHERMERISISMMLRGVGSLAALGGVLALTHNVALAAAAMAAWYFVCFAVYDVPNVYAFERMRLNFSIKKLYSLFLIAAPLAPSLFFLSVGINSPRYFIQGYLGEGPLGYFSALAYIPLGLSMVFLSFSQALLPRLSHYHLDNPTGFLRLLVIGIGAAMVLGISSLGFFYFWGKPIISLIYNIEYTENYLMLLILLAANIVFLLNAILGTTMTAARYFKSTLLINILFVLGTVSACFFFVPRMGLEGAAYSVLIGNAVQCSVAFVVTILILARLFRKTDATVEIKDF